MSQSLCFQSPFWRHLGFLGGFLWAPYRSCRFLIFLLTIAHGSGIMSSGFLEAPSSRLLVPLAVLTSSPSWCLVPFVHVLISLDGLVVFWQSGLSGVSCHRLDKSGTSCALSLAARSEERRVGK